MNLEISHSAQMTVIFVNGISSTFSRSLSLLQIDAVSLFLLYLVEMICSGLQIIYNTDEVNKTPKRLPKGIDSGHGGFTPPPVYWPDIFSPLYYQQLVSILGYRLL